MSKKNISVGKNTETTQDTVKMVMPELIKNRAFVKGKRIKSSL